MNQNKNQGTVSDKPERCCTEGLMCACNIRTCSCDCKGCYCGD